MERMTGSSPRDAAADTRNSSAHVQPDPGGGLPLLLADGLVFGASAAVLVLEILAIRLLAPYVGLTLETYTAIIGVVLAGIALGSTLGGRLADRVAPRRLLGPQLALGGALAIATVPLTRLLGDTTGSTGEAGLLVALVSLLPPAAVLSSVTPTVAKAQLRTLAETGTTVGRLSGVATFGALAGTFGTGYLLVPLVAVSVSLLVLGAVLVAAGLVLTLVLSRQDLRRTGGAAVAAVVLAAGGAAAGSPCDTETVYFCAALEPGDRPGTRTLVLDDLRHSAVDLADPGRLTLPYVQWIGAVIESTTPAGRPLRAVHVGGGGWTLPRYLAATRPGSRSTILEVDRQLVDFVRRELPVDPAAGPPPAVQIGDARLSLRDRASGSADLVVGDAFSSRAVPWHLATREFVREIRRVLTRDGVYTLNVIDRDGLALTRAVAATIRERFEHVALIGRAADTPGPPRGGNLVLAASARPLDLTALRTRLPQTEEMTVLDDDAVARLTATAAPLRDDFAPTDQLLSSTG